MSNIFEEEKQYLEYTKEALKDEMEYCQNELNEIPKRHTNVLQGDSFLVEGLMSNMATRLKKLELVEKSPYFGRIDFLSDDSKKVAKIYIGKTSITGKNNEQVTTDWRTPICSLYYDSDVGNASYDAPMGKVTGKLQLKRQIIIQDSQLIDVLDTNLVSNDELLQTFLSVNADNRMKTIIASIQKSQNHIIRKPLNENIIVQGVAGSGKSSVALHRVAYLVYSMGEKINSNQFLIIGPNKYFLNYISSILPELETEPVDQYTYIDLVNECINEKLTLEDKATVSNQDSNTNRKIQAFKSSLEYKKILDEFMSDYLKNNIVPDGFKINDEEVYSAETIRNILFSGANSCPNFERTCNFLVNNFKDNIDDIYSKLNEKYRQIYINLPMGDPLRDEAIQKSIELGQLIKSKGVKLLRDYLKKLRLNTFDLYKMFIINANKYINYLSEKEVLELQKSTLLSLKKKQVSFEDLPSLLHINNMLIGSNNKYKHIVIDEAQDFGLFHFDALKESFTKSTFSIYGDLAQSIYSYKSIRNWEDVVSSIFKGNCKILKLNKSYRTTIEITNNANKVLKNLYLDEADPVIRHGQTPLFSNCSKNDEYKITKINEWINKGYKTIAIICKTDKEASNVFTKLSKKGLNVTHITSKADEYKGNIFVLTSALSKGLEFDAVIINDASNNIYNKESLEDMHLLYVALTRALHELDILYDNILTDIFDVNEKTIESNGNQLVKKK